MSDLSRYDTAALVQEYAEAKVDYDRHRLDESFDGKEHDRWNRLVAIEQLLIRISGVTP